MCSYCASGTSPLSYGKLVGPKLAVRNWPSTLTEVGTASVSSALEETSRECSYELLRSTHVLLPLDSACNRLPPGLVLPPTPQQRHRRATTLPLGSPTAPACASSDQERVCASLRLPLKVGGSDCMNTQYTGRAKRRRTDRKCWKDR